MNDSAFRFGVMGYLSIITSILVVDRSEAAFRCFALGGIILMLAGIWSVWRRL